MNVESNYVIAIATLSDWLKRVAPVFQPMRSKTKTAPCTLDFSRAKRKLQVIARNCDWFVPVVIGRSIKLLSFWFFDSHLKTALLVL